MDPKQWYSQRVRSESHTSSDLELYQDTSEYLDLDVRSISSSFNKPQSSSRTEYLDLNPGSSLLSGSLSDSYVTTAKEVVVADEVEKLYDSTEDSHDPLIEKVDSSSHDTGITTDCVEVKPPEEEERR